jgi:xanthine/CO dehydrogenase XdhC/CoxF family maturation factor
MDDREIYTAVARAAEAGQRMALATVVRVKGSTPRGPGSKMLIAAGGEQIGTIGGGCGEAEVLMAAAEVIESGVPRLVRVDLTDDYLSWSPAVCGGVMEIFLEPLQSG